MIQAWNDVTYQTLNSAWKNLWSDCVTDRDFDRFEIADSEVLEDILSMGKSMGLDLDRLDVQELIDNHREELTIDELFDLQNEH